ncbi:hypothetical protein CEXT_96011 [Caerostris extrusa]|uniref:Uncharacterized protein n=1 Tax=Caerostris extrusa TaxID=172846 RepID=A0AAV4W271_CAEEX|nr:hypothetical protein CEXT_96011 [Caerostris extrusa]
MTNGFSLGDASVACPRRLIGNFGHLPAKRKLSCCCTGFRSFRESFVKKGPFSLHPHTLPFIESSSNRSHGLPEMVGGLMMGGRDT